MSHSPSPASPHRKDLVRLQRELFERNKKRIAEYEEVLTPGFDRYEEEYTRDVASFDRAASFSQLIDRVRQGQITIVGDYHTLWLSQKTFLKIAKRIRSKKTIIALEFFPASAQNAVDAYVRGSIAERTLLRRTRYHSRWPYDIWPHFKPIVDLARQRGWRVLALDTPRDQFATLEERDQSMAERLCSALEEAPKGTRILTLVGELHLAHCHLPAKIDAESHSRSMAAPRVITVFQNNETIYWQLVDERREQEIEVVQVNTDRFCILYAPPVVVQQSYLNWIEHHDDSLEYDNLKPHFVGIATHIARAFKLHLQQAIRAHTVYGPGDLSFAFEDLGWDGEAGGAEPLQSLAAEESHIWVQRKVVYLGHLGLNQVGEVAGRLVHSLMLNSEEHTISSFYGQVIHQACAFLGSKVLNPKRKGHHEPYFRKMIRDIKHTQPSDPTELEAASAILVHKDFERGRRNRAFQRIHSLAPGVTQIVIQELGGMLGERLYFAFSRGKMARAEIRYLFSMPLRNSEQAAALYFSLVRQYGREPIPRRI